MLRLIEFGLLAASLVVIIGLIVGGSRSKSEDTMPPADHPDAPERGKSL